MVLGSLWQSTRTDTPADVVDIRNSKMKNLPEITAKYLFDLGIVDIFLSKRIKNFIYPHMRLLNLLDSGKFGLIEEYGLVKIVRNFQKIFFLGPGESKWQYYRLKKGHSLDKDLVEIIEELKTIKAPKFVIDLSFVDILFPEERRSLINEIKDTYTFLSNYFLISNSLYIVNNKGLKLDFISNVYGSFDYSSLGVDKIYLLDPNADELFDLMLRPNVGYVIGGIVDKSNRLKGLTSFLCRDYDVERVKIEILGNPWLISQKIDSIIKAMVLRTFNEALDEYSALISVMNKEEIKRLQDFILQKLK